MRRRAQGKRRGIFLTSLAAALVWFCKLWSIAAGAIMRTLLITVAATAAIAGAALAQSDQPPFWAYPLNPPPASKAPPQDNKTKMHVPGSTEAFTKADVDDVFNVKDWFPNEHIVAPDVVMHGHTPKLWACGYCHTPSGQGRPENAALAGQPADYIVQQVLEMRSGNRRSAQPKARAPQLMSIMARQVSAKDLRDAADYFSKLRYTSRIRVVESAVVPKTYVAGVGMLAASPGGGTEPIGNRIIEVPENLELTELRDPHSGFVAYVPPGSIARGKKLVETGGGGAPCSTCHGAKLDGMAGTPALAGRSPSYLYRQLFDIQHGARKGSAVALMLPEVAHLNDADRIAIAAYIATRKP
jgi:cytochrome c553